jgi:hypothetical protein
MGLLSVIQSAGAAKSNIMNKFMNPNGDGMYGKASQFLGGIEDRKNELFNPATSTLGALGFGQNNFDMPGVGREIPRIEEMRAADTAKMMQNSLLSIGAVNPSAGMVSDGLVDLSTPIPRSPFVSSAVPRTTGADALKADLYGEDERRQREQSLMRGMLEDPNTYTPTPEAGMLRMA